jgi:predicted transcriptional regulator
LGGEEKPTKLMFKANISWNVIKEILEILVTKELVTEHVIGKVKRYKITEKGIQVISYYQRAVREIELVSR